MHPLDPLSSQLALSHLTLSHLTSLPPRADEATALVLKNEVSDGIIAPGFTPAALAILQAKKKGGFIILEANVAYRPPANEYREVYGLCFSQRRNDALFTADRLKKVCPVVLHE